jgi:hypothetical protein
MCLNERTNQLLRVAGLCEPPDDDMLTPFIAGLSLKSDALFFDG